MIFLLLSFSLVLLYMVFFPENWLSMAHIQRAGYDHAMPDEFEFADFDEDEDEFSEDMREDQVGSDFDDEFDSVSILSFASFGSNNLL